MTLLLLVVSAGLATRGVVRVQRETLELAIHDHMSTDVMGDVAARLGRLRSLAALGSGGSAEELLALEQRSLETEAELDEAIAQMPAFLDPEGLERWLMLLPRVDELRASFRRAHDLRRSGHSLEADNLLRAELKHDTSVHETFQRLDGYQRAQTAAALAATDRDTRKMYRLASLLAASVLAGIVAIWFWVVLALRRQERAIAEHMGRIRRLNEDLDAFAGRVAHDLRNALTPLVTSAAMLRRSATNPQTVATVSERIERSSARAIALLDGLLAFSRATWSASEEGENAFVRKAVADALEDLQPLIEQLQAKVEVDCEDLRLQCPQGLLSVIIANLCSNAVKFLEGRRERLVRITARRDDRTCIITVEDTGPGIPQTAVGRIFEPFFRVPGARAAGTGMGLATVARVVDRCRGKVRVDSTVGRGSRFEVRLPLAEQPTA